MALLGSCAMGGLPTLTGPILIGRSRGSWNPEGSVSRMTCTRLSCRSRRLTDRHSTSTLAMVYWRLLLNVQSSLVWSSTSSLISLRQFADGILLRARLTEPRFRRNLFSSFCRSWRATCCCSGSTSSHVLAFLAFSRVNKAS